MSSRKNSLSMIFRLKKKQALSDLIDYDQAFLDSLSEGELEYLANFLQDHYESPGAKPWRSSRRNMAEDAALFASELYPDEGLDVNEDPYNSEILIFN